MEDNYSPITGLIDELKLNYSYNAERNSLVIQKGVKSAQIMNDMPYIFAGGKKYFVGSFVMSEDGRFFLPDDAICLLKNYFSGSSLFAGAVKSTREHANPDDFFLDIKSHEKSGVTIDSGELSANNDINVKNNYVFSYEDDNKPKKIKINAIILDPGHGGSDPGAIGFNGTEEKNINLKTALILRNKLVEKFPDKKIIMTRDKDVFIPLEKRSQIANYVFNKYGASLFVSIHVNASRSYKTYGFETWILVEEYRRNILKKGEITKDKDVEKVLNSMLNDEIFQESKSLAKKVQSSMEKEIGSVSLNRGIKEQTYFVIKKSIMPAILVEIGFNTNKYEEIRLTKYEYLNKIADAIFKGTVNFIDEFEKTYGFTK